MARPRRSRSRSEAKRGRRSQRGCSLTALQSPATVTAETHAKAERKHKFIVLVGWVGRCIHQVWRTFFCVLGDRLYTCSSRVSALMNIILTHGALARRPGF